MLSFSQAPFRGTGPDQRDPALRIRRRAWKECKHEDIFKLFPAPVIRTLEGRGTEVSLALTHKEGNNLETSETLTPRTPTYTPPQDSSLGLKAEVPPLISPPDILLLQDSMFLRRGPQRYERTQGIAGVWEPTWQG